MKKTLVSIIAVTVTCLCCVVGSTFAWLVARANPISNTFTVGNVDIMLSDQTAPHKIMVPGATYTENQTVTVLAGSEDCWIFVHAHEENWTFVDTPDGNHSSNFISFDYAEGWTLLEDTIDVYYRKVTSSAESQAFPIIKNNTIIQHKMSFNLYAARSWNHRLEFRNINATVLHAGTCLANLNST